MAWSWRLRYFAALATTACSAAGSDSAPATLVADHVCDPLAVKDPAAVSVQYAAKTGDGHDFMSFEGAPVAGAKPRVFYGTPDRMVERRVIDASYDSSVHLTFDLDGVSTSAQLMYASSYQGFGPPRLQSQTLYAPMDPLPGSPGDGWENGLANLPDASPPPSSRKKSSAELTAGLTFVCF